MPHPLVLESLAHLMMDFEQGVSVAPQESCGYTVFSFTTCSGRIASAFTTSKQYVYELIVQK
jgi:hypothetical protein